VHFTWRLINSDPDDNKYVDAAVVGGTDYIVTNDQHFNILRTIEFPKVTVIGIENFVRIC
jgi:uncharacterized protein